MADLLAQLNPNEGVTNSNVTPLIASIPNGTSFGDSILMNSIVSPHPKFLDTISTYAASIPLKNFWIAAFKIPMLIDEANLRNYSEFFDQNNKAKDVLGKALIHESKQLINEYNKCLEEIRIFRAQHLEFAATYIHKQSQIKNPFGRGGSTITGTGGTPFMKYLKKHRDETQKQKI